MYLLRELGQRRSAAEVRPERRDGDDGRIILRGAGDADHSGCDERWRRLWKQTRHSKKMACSHRGGVCRRKMQC